MNSVDDKTASFFESKKILISGASGYIGSNLLNRLSEIKCEIACLTSNPKLKEFLVKEYKNRRGRYLKSFYTKINKYFSTKCFGICFILLLHCDVQVMSK